MFFGFISPFFSFCFVPRKIALCFPRPLLHNCQFQPLVQLLSHYQLQNANTGIDFGWICLGAWDALFTTLFLFFLNLSFQVSLKIKHTISTLGWRSQLVDMLQPQDVKKVCGFLVSVSAEAGKRLSGITYAASIKSYKLISQPENVCVITSRLIDIYL